MSNSDNKWCATCSREESCSRATICTVCGENLTASPPTSSATSAANNSIGNDHFEGAFHNTFGQGLSFSDEAAANGGLDPFATNDPNNSKNRPTATSFLERIPRFRIDDRSSLLHEAAVEIVVEDGDDDGTTPRCTVMDALTAEFGPSPPYDVEGRLAPSSSSSSGERRGDTVAYAARGGGVTFARKALRAQEEGARAIVIGNSATMWPYIMKDSKGESEAGGLDIPVVMVKKDDGQRLRALLSETGACVRCRVRAKAKGDDEGDDGCIICREPVRVGDTVMRPFSVGDRNIVSVVEFQQRTKRKAVTSSTFVACFRRNSHRCSAVLFPLVSRGLRSYVVTSA